MIRIGESTDFLKKANKKFGNSLIYEILEYIFIKKEVCLDILSAKFRVSKNTMYSIMRRLEGRYWVKRITYPSAKIFFGVIG